MYEPIYVKISFCCVRKKHKHLWKNSHWVYRFNSKEHRSRETWPQVLAERTGLGTSVSVSLCKNGPCHISWKNVTPSHTKICFLTCDVFCHILPKNVTFWPRRYKTFLNGKKCDDSAETKGLSYPDFSPASRLRFGWVTSHLSLFSVTKNVTHHICHISGKNVMLSHTNFFLNLWRFLSRPSWKMSHFGPASTNLFWTGRNVTIRLGLKRVFLFPSQICHLSRKREAGRPFGLRPTLIHVFLFSSQICHLSWKHMSEACVCCFVLLTRYWGI